MCVICSSPKGITQPSVKLIKQMFRANPDGAGYMFASNGSVRISKGYMTATEFLNAIKKEAFTEEDSVVYHFRITTQASRAEMTHPFPLSPELSHMEALELSAPIGVAHNGIIRMTSDGDKRYSDTAKFITKYLVKIIRNESDLRSEACMDIIAALTNSRFAIMDGSGHIAYAGAGWTQDENGLWFSNRNHEYFSSRFTYVPVKKITASYNSENNYTSKSNFRWPDTWKADINEDYIPG